MKVKGKALVRYGNSMTNICVHSFQSLAPFILRLEVSPEDSSQRFLKPKRLPSNSPGCLLSMLPALVPISSLTTDLLQQKLCGGPHGDMNSYTSLLLWFYISSKISDMAHTPNPQARLQDLQLLSAFLSSLRENYQHICHVSLLEHMCNRSNSAFMYIVLDLYENKTRKRRDHNSFGKLSKGPL